MASGAGSQSSQGPSQGKGKLFTDLKDKSRNLANMKMAKSSITGCIVMPNGQAVLCDYYNKRIH